MHYWPVRLSRWSVRFFRFSTHFTVRLTVFSIETSAILSWPSLQMTPGLVPSVLIILATGYNGHELEVKLVIIRTSYEVFSPSSLEASITFSSEAVLKYNFHTCVTVHSLIISDNPVVASVDSFCSQCARLICCFFV
jgi:hypothetical protein